MDLKFQIIILCLIFLVRNSICQDYYKLLEVSREASTTDIRRAFNLMKIKYSPDNNPGDLEVAQKLQDVHKAYDVLTNNVKKQYYDAYGIEGLNQLKAGANKQQTDMFGNPIGRRRGKDAKQDIHITLDDLYNGMTRTFKLNKNVICDHCQGTGSKTGKLQQCPHCKGQGVTLQTVNMGGMRMQMQQHCDHCHGKGRISAADCPVCSGKKVVPKQKQLEIVIEKGMVDDHDIVFAKESEQHPEQDPGDVIFTLKQKQHDTFTRFGDTLYANLNISLKDAIKGYKREIKHLDRNPRYVRVSNQNVCPHNYVQILKGEGMPRRENPNMKGDLHVTSKVKLPKELTEESRQILRELFALSK